MSDVMVRQRDGAQFDAEWVDGEVTYERYDPLNSGILGVCSARGSFAVRGEVAAILQPSDDCGSVMSKVTSVDCLLVPEGSPAVGEWWLVLPYCRLVKINRTTGLCEWRSQGSFTIHVDAESAREGVEKAYAEVMQPGKLPHACCCPFELVVNQGCQCGGV